MNATLGFGRTKIAPLLPAFARRHPEVEVQMEVTARPVDLAEQGFDLGIRFGAPSTLADLAFIEFLVEHFANNESRSI